MTPLEFFISVKNSDAKNGLEEVQQKIEGFKASTNELYEGPAREMKIRTEIRGMIKDIAEGQSPMGALVNVFERLTEVARWAGPLAAILAVITGIATEEYHAYQGSLDFLEGYKKAMSGDVKNMTVEQLKETQRSLQETDDKFKKLTWVQWMMAGGVFSTAHRNTQSRGTEVQGELNDRTNAEIEAKTAALRSMTDEQLAVEGEIAHTRLDYEEKIRQARKDNNEQGALDYQEQMAAAFDRLSDKQKKAEAEKFARERAGVEGLYKAQADEAVGSDRLASLQQQRADLEARLNSDGSDEILKTREDFEAKITAARKAGDMDAVQSYQEQMSAAIAAIEAKHDQAGFLDPTGQRVKDETELARLQKEINQEEADQKKTQAEKDKEAADQKAAADAKSERLRQDVLKAQFEALDKEDKIVVLKAAQAAIQKDLIEAGKRGTQQDRDRLQLDLARVTKQLGEAELKTSPFHGIDAENALRGSSASGQFNRVSNDAANRAEKQRDTMVGYLKTIASRGNINDEEAF